MRLVYLWVERYRCFQETGIHFTNKYEIEVGKKESKYYLSKCEKKAGSLQAEYFYGEYVSDFRIFVAENGKGKTTLFELLDRILKNDIQSMDTAILIGVECEEEGKEILKFWRNSDKIEIKNTEELGKIEMEYAVFFNDPQKDENDDVDSMQLQIDFICSHDAEKLNRWIGFPIPLRLSIYPRLEWKQLERYQEKIDRTASRKRKSELDLDFKVQLEKYYGGIDRSVASLDVWAEISTENKADGIKTRNILKIVCRILIYIVCKNFDYWNKTELEEGIQFINDLTERVEKIETDSNGDIWGKLSNTIKVMSVSLGNEKLNQLVLVLEQFQNIEENMKSRQNKDGMVLSIHNDDDINNNDNAIEKLQNFYDFYAKFIKDDGWGDLKFLTFSWGMSSGEQSMLNTFSYIYKFLKKWENPGPFVLMLDEIDLSLHPRWQQGYMLRLTGFLKEIMDEIKEGNKKKSESDKRNLGENPQIHLLVATHSPIVLSDVPGEFITYFKAENSQKIFSIVDTDKKSKTFGANIYDIYNDAFYLNMENGKGVIGGIASKKVKDILEKLSKIRGKLSEGQINEVEIDLLDCQKQIEYFDDDILKELLFKEWKRIAGKVKSHERELLSLLVQKASDVELNQIMQIFNKVQHQGKQEKIDGETL